MKRYEPDAFAAARATQAQAASDLLGVAEGKHAAAKLPPATAGVKRAADQLLGVAKGKWAAIALGGRP